jgi:hypothetical protein
MLSRSFQTGSRIGCRVGALCQGVCGTHGQCLAPKARLLALRHTSPPHRQRGCFHRCRCGPISLVTPRTRCWLRRPEEQRCPQRNPRLCVQRAEPPGGLTRAPPLSCMFAPAQPCRRGPPNRADGPKPHRTDEPCRARTARYPRSAVHHRGGKPPCTGLATATRRAGGTVGSPPPDRGAWSVARHCSQVTLGTDLPR